MTKIVKMATFFVAIIVSVPMAVIADNVPWGYTGPNGPGDWADMRQEFKLCGSGKEQSPINISGAKSANLPAIQFDYKPGSLEILHNGHTVLIKRAKGSRITVGGEKYELLQFHFHSPGENTVDGKTFPMEIHLVHKSAKGKIMVLGVFTKIGAKNAVLDKAWNHMPQQSGDRKQVASVNINAADLLPTDRSYYSFKGSITIPPCSEGIEWIVLKTPVEVSDEQIKQFSRVVGENARPVQPVYSRTLYMME